MKWYELYKKIGNQSLSKIQKSDVVALIDGNEIPLVLKFRTDGSPYLIQKIEESKEENTK